MIHRRRSRLGLFLVLSLAVACTATPDAKHRRHETITLFFTTDEHGHLEPREESGRIHGGVGNFAAALAEEGYAPDRKGTLLLSGGDMWTGATISTWFQGEPTVEVFNALGYAAAALGNHDFDFGREVLKKRAAEAKFPFLSANLEDAESGGQPDYARPFVVVEVGGVEVGIVGLSYPDTPDIVLAEHVEGLTFGDPGRALKRWVPEARKAGAKVVVVVGHLCADDLDALVPVAGELGVSLLLGGHCHSGAEYLEDGVLAAEGDHFLESFLRVDLEVSPRSGEVFGVKSKRVLLGYPVGEDNPRTPDARVTAIVEKWAARVDEALGERVGFTATGVPVSHGMYAMVTDAWLEAYPSADLAIANLGGFRQNIPPGDIAVSDVVAVLPFENTLYAAKLTGAQVLANLACCGGAVAGMTWKREGGSAVATLADGRPLKPDGEYRVLVNSFMYGGGDSYLFAEQDPNAVDTGIHWRDPVLRWIRSRKSTAERPLETMLEVEPRIPGAGE